MLVMRHIDNDLEHFLNEKGGKIGREVHCEIRVNDKEISKTNSEKIFCNGGFYISDKRSMNGTFVKLEKNFTKAELELHMIFEIGNFYIKVMAITENEVKLQIRDIPGEYKYLENIALKGNKCFGFSLTDEKLEEAQDVKKGFWLGKEEKDHEYEVEFKVIKGKKFLCLSPNIKTEYIFWKFRNYFLIFCQNFLII